jgi:hypothetical protein
MYNKTFIVTIKNHSNRSIKRSKNSVHCIELRQLLRGKGRKKEMRDLRDREEKIRKRGN